VVLITGPSREAGHYRPFALPSYAVSPLRPVLILLERWVS
jgi:hypothetical protein